MAATALNQSLQAELASVRFHNGRTGNKRSGPQILYSTIKYRGADLGSLDYVTVAGISRREGEEGAEERRRGGEEEGGGRRAVQERRREERKSRGDEEGGEEVRM